MSDQTRLQRQTWRDSQTPYLWVDYRPDLGTSWLIELVVKNEGPSTAEHVRILIDPPILPTTETADLGRLDELPAFKNEIASMPPGRQMRWLLGTHFKIAEEKTLTRHLVTISVDGPFGPVPPTSYILDYDDMNATSLHDAGSLAELTDAVKKLRSEEP